MKTSTAPSKRPYRMHTRAAAAAATGQRILLDHYEELGMPVLRLLAQEDRSAALRALADRGRAEHAAWCQRVFAPALAGLGGAKRARRLAQLIAVTDVLTWKLLRHDRHLSRRQTELALTELLQPLTGAS